MEFLDDGHCPYSRHGSMCYSTEDTESYHAWERHYLLQFTVGHPMGWVSYFKPLCEGKLLSHRWDPIVLLQARSIETHYTGMEHASLKEERRQGFWSGVSCPHSSPHTWQFCPPPALVNMCSMHNQVKFLKLTTSLSSRPGGYILFSTERTDDNLAAILFPSIALEEVMAHREALTKFT